MRILVSACLLGCRCRYDGVAKPHRAVLALEKEHTLVPVCPEQMGGLPTPRPPPERRGERVVTKEGADVTPQYRRRAQDAHALCRLFRCDCALLKERSPSCGHGVIYDGTFSAALTAGRGVTAELLEENGITVWGESDAEMLLGKAR